MKIHCLLLRLTLALTLGVGLASPIAAQAPTAGSVTGRVQNRVTGDYLNNARVSIKGTHLIAFTDDSGTFRLDGVPAGAATVRVFFTGLDEQEQPVAVVAGQAVQRDFQLTNKALYGDAGDTLKLDQFVVQATKETNAAAIAVNEQRFSANQKSVVSADQFGTIPDSNPGELMKWLPGVSVEYFANTIVGVSVRGLDAANTDINFDGMPVASTSSVAQGRSMEVRAASASDIARIEIQKIPLPENSSNSIGGTINLIRRSAFEYSARRIEYRALFTSDASQLTLAERGGPKDRTLQWWRPNLQVKWTEPVSKTLGFAVTVGHDDKITRVHWSSPTRGFGNAQQAALAEADLAAGRPLTTPSVYNPVKTQDLLHDNPIWNYKDYATLKVDWRPSPDLKLSYSISATLFRNQTADDVRILWNTGSSPVRNDEFSTYGATGAGFVRFDTREGWRDEYNPTFTNTVEVERRKGPWTLSARGSYSTARHVLSDTDHGFFNNMTSVSVPTGGSGLLQTGIGTGSANPRLITVNLLNQTKYFARTIEARDAATGQLIDWADPANLNIGGATSRQGESIEVRGAVRLFARRSFTLGGSNPLSVQLGFDYDEQYRHRRRYRNDLWTFVGADGRTATAANPSPDDSAAQIAAVNVKASRDDIYDAPAVPRLSMSRLYKLYQDHPNWFVAKEAESYYGAVSSPYQLSEKTYAPYLQFKGGLFGNRLGYAGGVRFEESDAWGLGLLDRGTKVLTPGLTLLQQYQIRYVREGARGEGKQQGYFPSLHLNYDLTQNLKFLIGYAKTQAKNRFDRTVIPATSVNDAAVTSGPYSGIAIGTLNVRNAELEPWIGHNYEAHLEYYTDQGGVIGVGAFRKNIHNWQTSGFTLLDTPQAVADWGFAPQYLRYQVSTIFNDGNGRLDGAEAELRQPLDRLLPAALGWLKGFAVMSSFNYNDLRKRPGDNISTDFSTLYSTQTKAALSYRSKWLYVNVGIINYGKVYRQRDDAVLAAVVGNGTTARPQYPARSIYGSRYYPPFNQIDFNLEYTLPRWAKGARVFVQGQNVTGARKLRERVVEGSPAWGRVHIENNLGQTYTAGINGTF